MDGAPPARGRRAGEEPLNAAETVFRPVEGAIVDLESLRAVAEAPDRLLSAWLEVTWPGASAVVLSGLELQGELSSAGPPGTVRPPGRSEEAVLSPGLALLTGRDGRRLLLRLSEPLRARWPTAAGPAVDGALVLAADVKPGRLGAGTGASVARESVGAVLGFVKPEAADQPFLLPIATAIGNGRDWATDLRRVWQPDHEALRATLKRFEALERTVWRAEPEGSVWDRQVLGRNWVRYQTVAASALQAARLVLISRATTTLDRVRLLDGLFEQLHGSVERAATELLQIIGPPEGAGPYRAVGRAAGPEQP